MAVMMVMGELGVMWVGDMVVAERFSSWQAISMNINQTKHRGRHQRRGEVSKQLPEQNGGKVAGILRGQRLIPPPGVGLLC